MPDSPLPSTLPEQVMRYRLRTLLAVTTVIAILAAIAGPYYRSVDSSGQRRLLVFWSMLLVCTGCSLWFRLRESVRRADRLHVRYVVYAASDSWSRRQRPSLYALGVLGVSAWMALASYLVGSNRDPRGLNESPFFMGLMIGSATAGLIFSFVRRPMYLCEAGIPMAKGHIVPWKYIRNAAWTPESPNVMKLRRYDGDVYLEVPPKIRDDVAAFIRDKIGADVMAVEGI